MSEITIVDIKTFITHPDSADLVVVKVFTSEEGLYGLGCATFTPRAEAVKTAVDAYLRPIMIGRPVSRIEDAWQVMYGSSYWRNGPVLNNAISGIDEALWDIKGKMAGMPVYELLGGKCREGAEVFGDAFGNTFEEVAEDVQRRINEGYRKIRLYLGSPEKTFVPEERKPHGAPDGSYYDADQYVHDMVGLFRCIRERFGDCIELMTDEHERMSPAQSVQLAKMLEPYHPYFLEDPLSPEQINWLPRLRSITSVPIAMGELFNNLNEFRDLIANQQIDYLRCHISHLGGLTPARKAAAFAELYGVKTAWHGPGDLSPIGVAAQLHLDLAVHNFGVQEFRGYNDATRRVFPGAPEQEGIYLYANDKPGLGVDFNEEEAAKYPARGYHKKTHFGRLPDGTAVRN